MIPGHEHNLHIVNWCSSCLIGGEEIESSGWFTEHGPSCPKCRKEMTKFYPLCCLEAVKSEYQGWQGQDFFDWD